MVRFRIHLGPRPKQPKTIPKDIRILAFNITDKCNLSCAHCFAQDNRIELDTDQCKEVLHQARKCNCKRVILCGKEPLMRKDVFEILKYIQELDMDVELMTNGVLITDEVIDKLKAVGLSRIQLSLDGFQNTHDRLRGLSGTYEKVIESLGLVLTHGFKTSVNTVVLEENKNEIPKLIMNLINTFPELAEVRLSRLIPTRFERPDYSYFKIYTNVMREVIQSLQTLDKLYFIEIEDIPIVFDEIIPEKLRDLVTYTPCAVITHTIDVLNNGDVVFCVPMGSQHRPHIHGNVLTDGLENIITKVRKYQDNAVDDAVCLRCEHYPIRCLGGCRCVAFAYRENEHLADPFCPRVRNSI